VAGIGSFTTPPGKTAHQAVFLFVDLSYQIYVVFQMQDRVASANISSASIDDKEE
jgi:hypothetical protein